MIAGRYYRWVLEKEKKEGRSRPVAAVAERLILVPARMYHLRVYSKLDECITLCFEEGGLMVKYSFCDFVTLCILFCYRNFGKIFWVMLP